MAKEEKAKVLSFDDFNEENLLKPNKPSADVDDEDQDDEEEQDEEEVKLPVKKVKKVKEPVVEEDEEELETEKPVKKGKEKVEEKIEEEDDDTPTPVVDEPEVSQTADAEAFFAEVEKLTGQELSVDYGDTDPLSPQGVALREAAVRESALDGFLTDLEEKFPVVFKALTHANNGGDPAELFATTVGRDYTKVDLKEGDDSLSKEILREYYKSRGIKSEAKIAKFIENDEDSQGGLFKEAQTALEEMKEEQTKKESEIMANAQRAKQEESKRDGILITAVDEILDSRQLGSFKIADRTEASQFRQFVLSSVRKVAGGKYELSTPVDSANLAKILQFKYFEFKKADLSKIIQQKADTENAKRLTLRLKSDQEKIKKTTQQEDKGKQRLSLKSYEI